MNAALRARIVVVCDAKIARKGEGVGLSFYAFFANRIHNPARWMTAATWWIGTHVLDHFERAVKIRQMVRDGL